VNCPHCDAKAKLSETLKVSRWKSYTCPNCGSDSTFTFLNGLAVYGLTVLTAAIGLWLSRLIGFESGLLIYILLLTLALYPAKALIGNLVPVEKTD
jgi:hypothetical protein